MIQEHVKLDLSNIKEETLTLSIDSVCGVAPQDNSFEITGYHDVIDVSGWVFLSEGKLLKDIYIKIGEKIYNAEYNINRSDVASHFEFPAVKNCGFSLTINAVEIENFSFPLEIIGEDDKGNLHIANKHIVKLIMQHWFNPKGNESHADLYHIIKQKEQEILALHEVIYHKNRQLFDVYNSKTWKLNKAVFSQINKFQRQTPQNGEVVYSHEPSYNEFLKANSINNFKKNELISFINSIEYKPKFSIIVPVYNVPPYFLDKCVQSVLNQIYPNWELCLYDDASTDSKTKKRLKYWAKQDQRIKVKFGDVNGHISHASNKAIEMAEGEFVCLLDNDDELTVDALVEVVRVLNVNPQFDFIYSDEDKIREDETYLDPYFKPDFSMDMLLSNNYICHFTTIRKSVGDKIGWFRKGYEGAQDHDLFLRIAETTNKIHHIARVLYHWRILETSTAGGGENKTYAHTAGIKAVEDHFKRTKVEAHVIDGYLPGTYRVTRKILNKPLVSIIIPFKDQVDLLKTCVNSVLNKTTYTNYEILLVSNNSEEEKTFSYLKTIIKKHRNIRFLEYNHPFNYSEINNWGVKQTKGEFVLLLNNDVEIITKEWLSEMVQHAQRKEVGAVGARLLYDDGSIQHAGVIIGLGGVAGHSHKYFPRESHGYYGRLSFVSNFTACTAACLLMRRNIFDEVGGLNESDLKVAFNDVDLCLKIRKAGYTIVYTPFAELFHYESKSRGQEDTPEKIARFQGEIEYMHNTWGTHIMNDPYYNPNLSKSREDFSLNI